MNKTILLMALFFVSCLVFSIPQTPSRVVVENKVVENKADNSMTLLFFNATWCGWCTKMENETLNSVTLPYAIIKIDIDKYPEIRNKFGVGSVPAYFLVKNYNKSNQKIIKRAVGYKDKASFLEWLEQ